MAHSYWHLLPLTAAVLTSPAWAEPPSAPARSAGPDAWPALRWQPGAASPIARVESPAAVVDNRLYLFGGFTDDLGASDRVDVYDPATDAWTRKKDMPTRLTHLNTAVDGRHIWFAGGFKGKHPGPAVTEVWKYDTAADTWTPGPPLPERRAGGGLAAVGGRLHYFGGYTADRDTNPGDHWSLALDGGKEWRREAALPDPRGHLGAFVLGGQVYALGGAHGHDKQQIDVDSCHRYDPAAGKWTKVASLPDGRSHFESSILPYQGCLLVVGGRCNSSRPPRGVMNDILRYDPRADRWTVVGEIPEKVMAPVAAIIGGRLVVTGGGLGNPLPLTASTRVAAVPKDGN